MQQQQQQQHPGELYARDEHARTATARGVEGGHVSLPHSPQVKQRVTRQGDKPSQPCHGITLEKKRHIISLLPNTARAVVSLVDKRLSQRLCLERQRRRESAGTAAPRAPHTCPDAAAKARGEPPDAKSAKGGVSRCSPGETLSDKENDARPLRDPGGPRGGAREASRAGSVPTGDQIDVGKRSKVPFDVSTRQQEAFDARRETVAMACPGNALSSAPRGFPWPGKPERQAGGSTHELSSSLPMPEAGGGSPPLSRQRARSRSVSLPLKADGQARDLLSFAGRHNSLNIREFTVEDGRAISRAGSSCGRGPLDEARRGEREAAAGGSKATRRAEDACVCRYAALDKDARSRSNGVAVADASCGQWDSAPVGRNPWLLRQEYCRAPTRRVQGTSPLESHLQPTVDSTPLNLRNRLKPEASNQNSHALNRSYEVQTPSPLWQQCHKQAIDAAASVPHGTKADPAAGLKERQGRVGPGASRRALSEERRAAPGVCPADERGDQRHMALFKEKQQQLRDRQALHHEPPADKPTQKYDQKDSKLQEQWALHKRNGVACNGALPYREGENGKHTSLYFPHSTDEGDGAARSRSAASQGVLLTRSRSALGLVTHSHRRPAKAVTAATPLDVQRMSNRVSAVAKGFLTRRLLRTEKVQRLVRVVKDSKELALSIHGDLSKRRLGLSDSSLHERLLKQIQGALEEIHDIFFVFSPGQRMAILKTDKGVQQAKELWTPEKGMVTRGTKSVSSRPLKLKLHHT